MNNIEYIKYLDVAQLVGGWPLRVMSVDTQDIADFPHFLAPTKYSDFKELIAEKCSESFGAGFGVAWVRVFWGPLALDYCVTRIPTFRYEMSEL